MEVLAAQMKVLEWKHEAPEKFQGGNSEVTDIALGLTPQDPQMPDCCYFNVEVTQRCDNESNREVFLGKARATLKIRNGNIRPSVAYLFDLMEQAVEQFAQLYHEKTQATNLSHHGIAKPVLAKWEADIQRCIDIWDVAARGASLN